MAVFPPPPPPGLLLSSAVNAPLNYVVQATTTYWVRLPKLLKVSLDHG
jgi:hypothetical protein